jgi:hypothetical protein
MVLFITLLDNIYCIFFGGIYVQKFTVSGMGLDVLFSPVIVFSIAILSRKDVKLLMPQLKLVLGMLLQMDWGFVMMKVVSRVTSLMRIIVVLRLVHLMEQGVIILTDMVVLINLTLWVVPVRNQGSCVIWLHRKVHRKGAYGTRWKIAVWRGAVVVSRIIFRARWEICCLVG